MAYCRWSSDNFKCDVYTYAHVDGSWTTHVAGRRRLGLETLPENPYTREAIGAPDWSERYKAYHKALGELPFVNIDLPHVGETFKDVGPKECADTLRMLRGLGYHVPEYAIEELDQEAHDPDGIGRDGGYATDLEAKST